MHAARRLNPSSSYIRVEFGFSFTMSLEFQEEEEEGRSFRLEEDIEVFLTKCAG